MNDTLVAFLLTVTFVCGITLGAVAATAYWQRRRNTEADANWLRYVESERQRNNMRHDLAGAQIRINTLVGERDLAAYQLTQLAAVATVATQQAQAGRGFILNENPLDRVCRNRETNQPSERTQNMPSPRKTFDKADLLTFLTETDDEAAVGSFTVIRPSPTLFGETENTTHEVQAITEAFWCERYQLALVIQRARVTGGGANALPVHHPLAVAHRSGKSEPRVNMRYGGTSSQLVRWAVELAEEWRGEVGYAVPKVAIDRTAGTKDGIVEDWGSGTVRLVPGDGQEDAQPDPEPEVPTEPTVDDPDSTPTGTTIDDVFAEHDDSDEGSAA